MINRILKRLIKTLLNWYYKRTNFYTLSWQVDETNSIHILSEEVFDTYTRHGIGEIPHNSIGGGE